MKRILLYLMVLVMMFLSIGGCYWDPWGRGGGRGGGGGEHRGGGGEHGGRH